jgi:putative ABC transport system permease protein
MSGARRRTSWKKPGSTSTDIAMTTLIGDVRFALRKLARAPGFTAMALLTLALGVGATAAIFSVVNGVLIKSLPYDRPDELVRVFTEYPDGQHYALSPPDFMSIREGVPSLRDASAFAPTPLTITGLGEPRRIQAAVVGKGFFELFGAAPQAGRFFGDEDHVPGQNLVLILSHAFWQNEFGGDRAAVGRTMTVNGVEREILGVLPPGFDYPEGRQAYVPVQYGPTFDASTGQGRRGEYLSMVGRLAPGATLEGARAELAVLGVQLSEAFPETNTNARFAAVTLREHLLGELERPLVVLMGAVLLVLLIACANVANLLLARGTRREGELAVRTALGASRGRVIRQLVTESLVLALAGGLLGLVVATLGVRGLLALAPQDLPRLAEVRVDARVMAFTLLAATATGLLFGVLPALQLSRRLGQSLRSAGRGGATLASGGALRTGLVVAEMALAVMLLVGAGLLIRSFANLVAVDPGFRTEHALTFPLTLPGASYPGEEGARDGFARMFERLVAVPGVTGSGGASDLPMDGRSAVLSFAIEGREPSPPGVVDEIDAKVVTPGYLEAMGVRPVVGRTFTAHDRADAPPVAIVNEEAVRRFMPEGDPVGRRIAIGGGDELMEIVGVIPDLRQEGPETRAFPEILVPQAQIPQRHLEIVLRTDGDPLALTGAVRAAIHSVDPALPVEQFRTLDQLVAARVAPQRFFGSILSLFAALALTLAAIGIFGVTSYTVAQRTREIGIRMALGAEASGVVRMIVGRGLRHAAVGAALGLLGAVALTRVLRGQLFEVSPTDPATLAGVVVVLGAVVVAASYIPGRAATRVSPATALREE